ncbi:L-seryl-tRNA(Sec) selenium transferase [Heliorestis convoluta]|uniref:L-seryl-tRNA(Sec) selenium transferase n=1 Tax=Heliorestis convoluta TaxID=356322 RepID=A0A5Q2N0Y5_9FIRM|nr:L-seryl-tRNA(Sec) selenium transferase [Heliorestis convoluta]QGG46952.1 L-seryl-tRNA(sec) selenium transferase [Heliorestis convoluta]
MLVQDRKASLRNLPAVHHVLSSYVARDNLDPAEYEDAVKLIQGLIAQARENLLQGKQQEQDKERWNDEICSDLKKIIGQRKRRPFRRVLNGTGIILHTNLGRAPLAEEAIEAIVSLASSYSNLEFDLATGQRGKRYDHVRGLLRELTGAEDAIVVNNNAAAVLLVLTALASKKEVVLSRGELVEIGGSFRIPDVMAQSGAIMIEVGTTNKTKLKDYQNALTDETALILKVHPSNYKIIGFTASVSREELVALARQKNIPVVEDLGSGVFISQASQDDFFGEPTVQKVVASGVDVVTFSGDKLLGGPQGGIIVGKKEWIAEIEQHPLTRALRVDKLTLVALEETLKLYIHPEKAKQRIPALCLLYRSLEDIEKRAQAVMKELKKLDESWSIELVPGTSQVGGGTLPEMELPTWLIQFRSKDISTQELADVLRSLEIPVIGRLRDQAFCIDMRTIREREEKDLCRSLQEAFQILNSHEQK